jgi:hypothetical protein
MPNQGYRGESIPEGTGTRSEFRVVHFYSTVLCTQTAALEVVVDVYLLMTILFDLLHHNTWKTLQVELVLYVDQEIPLWANQ